MVLSRLSIPSTGRILGVDPGERWIGLALSDPDRVLAQPLATLDAAGLRSTGVAILEVARQHEAVAIVVGLPVNMDGSEGPAHAKAVQLIEILQQGSEIPICGWDERLTSVQAERVLISSGMRRSKRRKKGVVDQVAAALILESFLASLVSITTDPGPIPDATT